MKAIIITSQRSGSNFLRHCLDSHPQVTCDGELLIGGMVTPPRILQDRRLPAKIYKYLRAGAWRPVKILEGFLARNDAEVVAFKAMYNQLANRRVVEFLRQHTEIRVIHLRRDNLLKQYISKLLIGKKRERRWQPHATHKVPIASTYVSPAAAIQEMQRVRAEFENFERLLSQHEKIELVYEDMIDGQCLSDEVTQAVCGLLELEVRPMCCDYVKVNPNQLNVMVENYEELAEALRGTPFERFLDE